jgi:hypothetical protein
MRTNMLFLLHIIPSMYRTARYLNLMCLDNNEQQTMESPDREQSRVEN